MTFGLTNRRSAYQARKTTSVPSVLKKRCETPEDIEAPPLESEDDESEHQNVSKPGSPTRISDADSSDELTSSRHNDITSTVFSGAKPKRSKPLGERQGAGKVRVSKRHHEDDDRTSDGSPAKRRSISPSKDREDEFLRNRKLDGRRGSNKAGYGRKSAPGRALESKTSGKAKAKAPEGKPTSASPPRLFAPPSVSPSPKKDVPRASLKRPGSLPSSPPAERPQTTLKIPGPLADSPSKPRQRKRLARHAKKEDSDSELQKSAPALLKIPGLILGEGTGEILLEKEMSDAPASHAGSNASILDTGVTKEPRLQIPSALDSEATCPFCYQAVDGDMLRRFSKGKTLSIRQQMKFCDFHKKNSAEGVWKDKGYPSIDWDHLDNRLERHQRPIRRIIEGGKSHYKSTLAEKLATGQERTLKQTERSLAPGYYGNRGLRIMSEFIIRRFNELLRDKAVDDPVISGRGTTVFVSTVLVPELATRLIMEDMSVDMEEAREILAESVDMGDLLHEDVADVMRDVAGEG